MRYQAMFYAIREGSRWKPAGGMLRDVVTGKVTLVDDSVLGPVDWLRDSKHDLEAEWKHDLESGGNGITESWSRVLAFEKREDAERALSGDESAVFLGHKT